VWLCDGYLRDVVKGCDYVMVYLRVWLCCEYLSDVAMIWVFKGCGYVMGI
jgi:hypothetical protein